MATAKDLSYIRYCLSEGINLDFAKKKLLNLIKFDKDGDGRLYALLADFTDDLEEKKSICQKALEIDPNSSLVYWKIFMCDVSEKEYQSAKQNLQIYKNLLEEKGNYCNCSLLNILLDELLEIEGQEYLVDEYYNTVRLKGDKYEEYCNILLALQDENYERAYYCAKYLDDTYKDIHLGVVLQLMGEIMLKKEQGFQKVKIDEFKI